MDRTNVISTTARTSSPSQFTTMRTTPTKPRANGTPAPSVTVCARSRSSAGSAW